MMEVHMKFVSHETCPHCKKKINVELQDPDQDELDEDIVEGMRLLEVRITKTEVPED